MKAKIALIAALPAALSLAACGDASNEVDGSDTTSMEPAAVEPMPTGMTEPMATDTGMPSDAMAEDVMGEDGTMADEAMAPATPTPMATPE